MKTIELLKKLYRAKIWWMFHFSMVWNEVATPVAAVRDMAVVLAAAKLLFGISLGWRIDATLCAALFAGFPAVGVLLKRAGLPQYANRLNNSINPDIGLIPKIAKHLGVYDDSKKPQAPGGTAGVGLRPQDAPDAPHQPQ